MSKRTFGVTNSSLHTWYGSPVMVKSMWTMAVSQHQFYLDKKHSKVSFYFNNFLFGIATLQKNLFITHPTAQKVAITLA